MASAAFVAAADWNGTERRKTQVDEELRGAVVDLYPTRFLVYQAYMCAVYMLARIYFTIRVAYFRENAWYQRGNTEIKSRRNNLREKSGEKGVRV